MNLKFALLISTVLIVLISCQQNDINNGAAKSNEAKSSKLEMVETNQSVDDPVLVKIDGNAAIYQSQFELMFNKLTSGVAEDDKAGLKPTILEGLVRTRVLADLAEQQLDNDESKFINTKLRNFKDELLVKSYISKNITAKPITVKMVKQYYQEHINDYRIPGKVNFEMIVTTSSNLSDEEMNQIIDAFSNLKKIDNWKLHVSNLKKEKLPVEYNYVSMRPDSINKELRSPIEKLGDGEISDIVFGDYIYIVKVINRESDFVKPLSEVSVDIRKKLAPQKLKEMLTQHIDKAMSDKKIEYIR